MSVEVSAFFGDAGVLGAVVDGKWQATHGDRIRRRESGRSQRAGPGHRRDVRGCRRRRRVGAARVRVGVASHPAGRTGSDPVAGGRGDLARGGRVRPTRDARHRQAAAAGALRRRNGRTLFRVLRRSGRQDLRRDDSRRRRLLDLHAPRAVRRRRPHHAVELADQPDVPRRRTVPRRRQHGRRQAVGDHAAVEPRRRAAVRRGRAATRRLQRDRRPRRRPPARRWWPTRTWPTSASPVR